MFLFFWFSGDIVLFLFTVNALMCVIFHTCLCLEGGSVTGSACFYSDAQAGDLSPLLKVRTLFPEHYHTAHIMGSITFCLSLFDYRLSGNLFSFYFFFDNAEAIEGCCFELSNYINCPTPPPILHISHIQSLLIIR